MRTSITNPLLIAEVQPSAGFGKIGLTLCPGKKQRHSATGPWDRDLQLDLDVIADWNAAVVVTLMEAHELEQLQVPDFGANVGARYMGWYHLPIVDASIPASAFETQWPEVSERLRALLRSGCNVLLHCMGGLGRTGTIAARLLVELGWEPEAAITAVRSVRPGAIETSAQQRFVMAVKAVPEARPDTSLAATRDRAMGAMLGLAVGDAVGTTLEFSSRDSQPRLTEMVGGGPFRLKLGEWTDDTALALALMDSLLDHPELDEADLMHRFCRWHEEGAYSCTGTCFDIGNTTRQALSRWKRTGDPIAGATTQDTAGNGSLMRLAPVPIRHWRDRDRMRNVADRQSRTTHAAPEAVDACVAYSEIMADAINGGQLSQVLATRDYPYAGTIAGIMAGEWRGKRRDQIRASGYVAHSMEASLWCVARTSGFEDAVLLAANLGEDADTTSAITGQLAGAIYGIEGIPAHWRENVAWGPRIIDAATRLFDASSSAG